MTTLLPSSPAAERNSAPILAVLETALAGCGSVLEIASGTGQHLVFFAAALPHIQWQPSETNPDMGPVISARIQQARVTNVLSPLDIDVCEPWPELSVDAVIVANLLHISPLATLPALCAGARGVCRPGGVLHIYGPFKQLGEHTAISNAEFDASLRMRDPAWGIRDIEAVIDSALKYGWQLQRQISMPANNFSLVFEAV